MNAVRRRHCAEFVNVNTHAIGGHMPWVVRRQHAAAQSGRPWRELQTRRKRTSEENNA